MTEGNPASGGAPGTTNATFTVTFGGQHANRDSGLRHRQRDGNNGNRLHGAQRQSGVFTGQSSETITVPVWGYLTDEADETFFVNLTNATNASLADSQGRGTIIDNDNPPAFTINDVTATEGDTGTTSATFTVGLSATSGQTISINAITS